MTILIYPNHNIKYWQTFKMRAMIHICSKDIRIFPSSNFSKGLLKHTSKEETNQWIREESPCLLLMTSQPSWHHTYKGTGWCPFKRITAPKMTTLPFLDCCIFDQLLSELFKIYSWKMICRFCRWGGFLLAIPTKYLLSLISLLI